VVFSAPPVVLPFPESPLFPQAVSCATVIVSASIVDITDFFFIELLQKIKKYQL
jgi:hypothetical protein